MKKFALISTLLLLIIIGTYLVLANPGITLVTPADNANLSGNVTFNATALAGDNIVNMSFYYNDTYFTTVANTSIGQVNFNITYNTSSITDNKNYVFNATGYSDAEGTTQVGSDNKTGITVDNTVPAVAITTPTAGQNKSGNIVINTSIQDPTSYVQSVDYKAENASGNQTPWTAMSLTGGGASDGNWSATFTSTDVSDGTYNITINATDYVGKQNATEKVEIVIDNADPAVSLSCSPISVFINADVTCTCAANDTTSGVASYSYALSTSTSSSASQSTSAPGTFTETCTISDYAGNSNSAATSYIVKSGGLPAGWTPPTTTYNIGTLKEAGVTKEVKADEKVKFVSEEVEYVATIDEVTSTTAELTIADQTFTLSVGDEKKLDLDEDDVYEASVTLVGIAQSKAELTFKAISEAVPIEEEFEEELCGNGVVDGGENCENCPEDVKCAADEECKEGVCEKKEVAPPKAKLTWLWIALGALVVIGIVVYLATKKKK